MSNLQIAVIGCGAIADQYYFPALAGDKELRSGTWIVDPSEKRRKAVIEKFGFSQKRQFGDAGDLPPSVGLAINATPSHLHVATTMPLINRGINVIVEKPFAEFSDHALSMVKAADGKCILSVNQYRRLAPSYALVCEMIQRGDIGEVKRITWREGHKFDWPTETGFYFRRPWESNKPRGALLDIGVHILDQICWWLQDTPKPVAISTDGYGGPEAFANATMTSRNATVEIAISFHSTLANAYMVEGTKGCIRGSTTDHSRIEVRSKKQGWRTITAPGETSWPGMAKRLVTNVSNAVQGREKLLVPASDVVPALVAIDSLYAMATEVWPTCYKEWKS
ncbi:putative dehydrogenase [Nitrobacteraceae bacterium AZCC 2146]